MRPIEDRPYAAVAANMPNREFGAPNVVSERSKTFSFSGKVTQCM